MDSISLPPRHGGHGSITVVLDLRVLRYFVAVAEAGSLTAGAEVVRISQPAVSRQLRALERELGADLFVRGHGALQLTRAGDRMLVVARDLLQREGMARQVLHADDGGTLRSTPDLTIVAPLATLHDLVAPMLADEGARLPIIDGIEAEPATVFDEVVSRGADLGLSTVAPPAGWRSRRLPEIPMFAQVPADHPIARRDSVDLEDLLTEPLIVMNRTNMARLVVDEALSGIGRAPAQFVEMRSSLLAQGLAAAGRGVALLTNRTRFDLVGVPVRSRGLELEVAFHAGWDADHYAAPQLAELVDRVAEFCTAQLPYLGRSRPSA